MDISRYRRKDIISDKKIYRMSIECQAEEICNMRYYKHSEERKDYRNSHSERGFLTS